MKTIEKLIFSIKSKIFTLIVVKEISFIFDKPIQPTGKLWYEHLDKLELSTDCWNQALNIQKICNIYLSISIY